MLLLSKSVLFPLVSKLVLMALMLLVLNSLLLLAKSMLSLVLPDILALSVFTLANNPLKPS
jgi:hypothetical protein